MHCIRLSQYEIAYFQPFLTCKEANHSENCIVFSMTWWKEHGDQLLEF